MFLTSFVSDEKCEITNTDNGRFYARQLCFARLSHRLHGHLSVCPSLCPSVTPLSPIKTVLAIITKFSLWAASRTLVFRDKISCFCVRGFFSNEGVKKGVPRKNIILPLLACLVWKRLQIGTDKLLIITSTGHGLFSFINIDDHERLWSPKRKVCRIFRIFGCSAYFNNELRQNDWR